MGGVLEYSVMAWSRDLRGGNPSGDWNTNGNWSRICYMEAGC